MASCFIIMPKTNKPASRYIFFMVAIWFTIWANFCYAQCAITSLSPEYCENDAPIVLASSPGGLNFYRSKVAGSITSYDPSLFGEGIDTVVATNGLASTYTISTSGAFNPIVRPGTIVYPGDDGETGLVSLPFVFNFFGVDHNQIRIGRNAVIGFGAGAPVNITDNSIFPDPADPNDIIAAAWDDLDLGGTIQYFTVGIAPFRKFVIDYYAVPREVGLYPITTQIQLHETTNIIELHTTTALFATNGNIASQGIENADGSLSYPVPGRNNTGWDATNDYVAFIPDCIDIKIVSVNGINKSLPVVLSDNTICEGGTATVVVGGSVAGVDYQVFDQDDNQVSSTVGGGGDINIITNALTSSVTNLKVRATNSTSGCSEYLSDVESISVSSEPTAASAGGDINLCNNMTSFTLNGNAPGIGAGQWQVMNGSASITSPGAFNSQVTGITPGSSAVLKWVISNGDCAPSEDTVILTNSAPPSVADAGAAQIEQCNNGIFVMNATPPAVGSGSWSIVSGSGSVTNPSSATTTITGVAAGDTTIVRWTVASGSCVPTIDDIILINQTQPTVSDAGADQSVCANSVTLNANTPVIGTGAWSIVSGTAGSVTNLNDPLSTFDGTAGNSYTLRWTITNGLCSSIDDVHIAFKRIPDAYAANQEICSQQSTSISITNPNTVSGTQFDWIVQSSTNTLGMSAGNGSVISQLLRSSDGLNNGTVVYQVTPSANGCSGMPYLVTATVKPVPVITNTPVSLSQQICSGQALNFIPAANVAGSIFSWSASIGGPINSGSISPGGSGNITDIPVNTGTVNGTVTYNITPFNNLCSGLPVSLVVSVKPLPSASAPNSTICSGENAVINISASPKNIPGTTYTWTASASPNISGHSSGNGSTINQILTTTNNLAGSVTYGITPSANGCDGPVTSGTVTVNAKATAFAGNDFKVCESTTIQLSGLLGGSAVSGTWEKISGSGMLSGSTTSWPNVTATYTVDANDVGGTVTMRLRAHDPDGIGQPCMEVTDDVVITINRKAGVTVPSDYTMCETASINLSGVVSGGTTTGTWNLISGSGTLSVSSITPLSMSSAGIGATYNIAGVDIGSTMLFRLTSNDPDGSGPCAAEADTVAIHMNQAAKVDAAENAINTIEICENNLVMLDGSFAAPASAVTWSGPGAPSQFGDVNNPNTTYTLSPADIAAGTITLNLTTNDPDGTGPGGPCMAESSAVTVVIHKLPTVVIGGLDPSYAENDPTDDMVGGPPGGTFTGPGVVAGTNLFNPSNANIGFNAIVYAYTSDKGCTNTDTTLVVVNELTEIDFGVCQGICADPIVPDYSSVPEICANIGKAYLEGSPEIDDGYNPTLFEAADAAYSEIIGFDGNGYYVNTDGLTSGIYYIRYKYTNASMATSVIIKPITVYAAPVANIGASNSCVEDSVLFTDLSTIPGNTLAGNITEWLWDFDVQGLASTNRNPTFKFSRPDVYDIRLTVVTDQGCSHDTVRQLNIGPVPQVDFEWTKICSGERTEFIDLSKISESFSTIERYQWDFGDGIITQLDSANRQIPASLDTGRTTGTYQNPNHLFGTFNEYTVRLTVETDVGCVSYMDKRVYILDYPAPTPTMGYFEDFENGPGTWVKTSMTGTSWVFGLPAGATINHANSGLKAWWTGGNGNMSIDQSTYFNNEASEVIGPCLDLTGLTRPMVSLNYWADSQNGFDGAVLQYSTDGGRSWETIGDNSGAGIYWYNSSNLRGNPGGQDNFAWSSTTAGWKNARFNLDQIPRSVLGQVVFRIAFGSNDDNPAGKILNGFAFDDIYIGEKQRNVLVEHFTNLSWAPANTANDDIDNLAASQSDFFKIQYHVSNPGFDSLNYFNPSAPAARGLFYGVAQPPSTVMDGILSQYYNTSFNGNVSRITREEIDRRSLEDPLFRISVNELPASDNIISAALEIEYVDSLRQHSSPVIVQLALVETDVTVGGSDRVFKNVVRKLLLDDTGLTINPPWGYGQTQEIEVQELVDVRIQDKDNLYLVAFVQDKVSKHILQSRVIKASPKTSSTTVALEDNSGSSQVRDLLIYPVPASNTLHLQLDNVVTGKYTWEIADQRGVVIKAGMLQTSLQEIDVSGLSGGVYFVVIRSGNNPVLHRKVVVINRH